MSRKVWDEITYPFPNFNGCTVEVWEWISNFIPHFMMDVSKLLIYAGIKVKPDVTLRIWWHMDVAMSEWVGHHDWWKLMLLYCEENGNIGSICMILTTWSVLCPIQIYSIPVKYGKKISVQGETPLTNDRLLQRTGLLSSLTFLSMY